MIDHFALLDEARRPWLDAALLKEKYFALSRNAPPSAEVNEAFRVLSDPKLRLHHFLQLAGADLAAGRPVPANAAELVWHTGTLLREIERWLLRDGAATSALARAVLQSERAKLKERLGKLDEKLRAAFEEEMAQLEGSVSSPNDNLSGFI